MESNAASKASAVFVNYSVTEMGFNDNGRITVVFNIVIIFLAC